MKLLQLRKIIAQGEGLQVEFKAALSTKSPRAVCKEIAALATSRGGVLLLGVADDGTIVGLDSPAETKDRIERWVSEYVFPIPVVDSKIVNVNGSHILAVQIEKTDFPIYSFDHQYYQRVGSSSVLVPPEKLADLIRGRPIEAILKSIETNVSVAQSVANVAMVSVAPGITGQGDLATQNYNQLRETFFQDLAQSALVKSLESGIALAQSLASVAMSSVAPAIYGQGDLATSNYDAIRQRLLAELNDLVSIKSFEARCLVLESMVTTQQVLQTTLELRIATLEAKLKSLAS